MTGERRAITTRDEAPIVLCVNAGSSSLKFSLFAKGAPLGPEPRRLAKGAVERIGRPDGVAWLQGSDGAARREARGTYADHAEALRTALAWLVEAGAPEATCVGHRIVHGGARFVDPVVVDEAVLAGLKSLVALAPLHLPASLSCLEAMIARSPITPQIACFDTAFHARMPEVARRLPLPDRFVRDGLRRFGFHGLSYEHVMSVLGPEAPRRIVAAHLGAGASVVAIEDGRSIDTTMGLTPAGGVVMATRPGDLDPGVLLHLLRHEGLSDDALEHVVERESGLSAIGGTGDMQALLARAPTDARAEHAVEAFAYGVKKAIGSFVAALGGLDLLVFTGGIGEHAAPVRARISTGLEPFGVALDPARNERSLDVVSAPSSRVPVRVIRADEDLVIARHAFRVLAA